MDNKVIYHYNWKNKIQIFRHKNGEWRWESSPKVMFDMVNKGENKKYNINSYRDWLSVGVIVGAKRNPIHIPNGTRATCIFGYCES